MKRTYNLSEQTVARVRELSARYGAAPSQDRVVELAVERLYRSVREQEEAEQWSRAADDPEFREEALRLAREYGDRESWPA